MSVGVCLHPESPSVLTEGWTLPLLGSFQAVNQELEVYKLPLTPVQQVDAADELLPSQ